MIKSINVHVDMVSQDPFKGIRVTIEGPLARKTVRLATKDEQERGDDRYWLGVSRADAVPDVEGFQDGSQIYCLPIHCSDKKPPEVSGILLEPTCKAQWEYYRRGHFPISRSKH